MQWWGKKPLTDTVQKVSVFGVILVRIFPHSDWMWGDTPYSLQMQENADQNNSKYEHFSRSVKRRPKMSKKLLQSRRKKTKMKKHWRYSSLSSPLNWSRDDFDNIKYRSNEGNESTDSRFRVASEEDQYQYRLHIAYKYRLNTYMAQYANVHFDTYIKQADL